MDAATGTGDGFGLPGVAAAALGIATVAVLWRLYLRAAQADTARDGTALDGTTSDSTAPGGTVGTTGDRTGRALTVAGAALAAIGGVLVLLDPLGTAGPAVIGTVAGGPALALAGDLVRRRSATGRTPFSRVAAIVALAVTALIGYALPPLVLAALAFAVTLLLALGASGWFRLPSLSVRD
ncbi:low temperature requirement A protein (LtrA) [Glycomyces sambucus]|uniref:Low temperature requirement A protein (LtrA) n=1 Tax=Glycomyces sambucus TaxID=380244 RepID=A0A1G9J9T3_9ACTN|nr:low temperature requirement protein A [Glycomyces sambucus]SDL33955.1 low temperature requirement A protein (LtrA) [Glycomyces sambucus]